MNRLSGWGKSEDKERAEKQKGENERRDGEGVGKEEGGRGKGETLPPCPLPQSMLGLLIYFRAFSLLWSLFTGL